MKLTGTVTVVESPDCTVNWLSSVPAARFTLFPLSPTCTEYESRVASSRYPFGLYTLSFTASWPPVSPTPCTATSFRLTIGCWKAALPSALQPAVIAIAAVAALNTSRRILHSSVDGSRSGDVPPCARARSSSHHASRFAISFSKPKGPGS